MTNASEQASMDEILSHLRRRQRRLRALQHAIQGLLYGTVAALGITAMAAILQSAWLQTEPWLALLSIPAAVVLGMLIGLLRPVDTLRIARALDHAAGSEDRFASAWQLSSHHRRARAELVMQDALSRVSQTPSDTAVPLRAPGELKWLPLPGLALAILLWLAPGPRLSADVVAPPEVTPEEWSDLHDELRQQLDKLPKPQTDDERNIADRLEELASLLKKDPTKKEVLAKIASLQTDLENRRQNLGTRDVSMRQAARSLRSSASLQSFASMLRQGDYRKAAEELRKLAEQLRENTLRLSATDFEAMATDFDSLALELAAHEQLSQSCRDCAGAANSMNRDKLAESLTRLSSCLNNNCDDLKRCDCLCCTTSLLDQFKRRLCNCGRCGKCGGSGSAFVMRSNRKGGLRAGWGTADNWAGGALSKEHEQRLPVLAETRERTGSSSAFAVVSKEERARSAQAYRELYADLVQKAEADLALESVPVAYREFLRRYFVAIRPPEETSDSDK